MPLVIFFVPEPARDVAEMARAVRPGGIVSAYAWDMPGGGFPYDALQREMRNLGAVVPQPPSTDASRLESLRERWHGAGLEAVETHEIRVARTFADFDDYWATVQGGPSVGRGLAAMTSSERALLTARMRELFPADADGRITCTAKANAITGVKPRQR